MTALQVLQVLLLPHTHVPPGLALGCICFSSRTPSFSLLFSLQHPLFSSLFSRENSVEIVNWSQNQQNWQNTHRSGRRVRRHRGAGVFCGYTWKTPGIPVKYPGILPVSSVSPQILPQTSSQTQSGKLASFPRETREKQNGAPQTPSVFPGNFRKRKVLGTLCFPFCLPEKYIQANPWRLSVLLCYFCALGNRERERDALCMVGPGSRVGHKKRERVLGRVGRAVNAAARDFAREAAQLPA